MQRLNSSRSFTWTEKPMLHTTSNFHSKGLLNEQKSANPRFPLLGLKHNPQALSLWLSVPLGEPKYLAHSASDKKFIPQPLWKKRVCMQFPMEECTLFLIPMVVIDPRGVTKGVANAA